MSADEVLACQFQEWYPRLKQHTIRSRILPLPEDFVAFLNEDSVVIPQELLQSGRPALLDEDWSDGTRAGDERPPAAPEAGEGEEPERPDEEGGASGVDVVGGCARSAGPFFPDLVAAVGGAIEELGGAVFPKLNWSSPKDATWVAATGSLRCTSPGEVLLLLKSSSFVAHDLGRAFDLCSENPRGLRRPEQFVLVLRRWCRFEPSREFRGFVVGGQLVGICQRDHLTYFPHLSADPDQLQTCTSAVRALFADHLLPSLDIDRFVFDALVDGSGRAWLVDVNPYGPMTEPLMYSYDELESDVSNLDPVRVVHSQVPIRAPVSHLQRLPQDILDIARDSGGNDSLAAVLRNLEAQRLAQAEEDGEEDQDDDDDEEDGDAECVEGTESTD